MAAREKPLIAFFNDIDKEDLPQVGGKAANLGEMTRAKFPVPSGFAVTVYAYDEFLKENNLEEEIYKILRETDVNKADQLKRASSKIRRKISSSAIPKEVSAEIIKAYHRLSGRLKGAITAVRSSATAEDLPGASFAGQQATYLNVIGEANLTIRVRDCWASLFTARAIFYREQNKIPHRKVKIAVVVQKMVQSEVSGVMFTLDPLTLEKDRIVIEAIWGLGELLVQGSIVPDRYIVQKDTFSILSKETATQNIRLVREGRETREKEVPEKLVEAKKLTDEEIVALAKIGDELQKHYYFPQDIEWAKTSEPGGKLYIVQTRPVTTLEDGKAKRSGTKGVLVQTAGMPLLTGSPASPGIGTGYVKILKSPKELNKVKPGDVLVSVMTSPDYVTAMKKVSAIVTDEGGMTSHAAIVSRELGIPCVVGTKEATLRLKENSVITVDGSRGFVYLGSKVKIETAKHEEKVIKAKTATKLYVNLAETELAKNVSKMNVDGVGLLRAEFMIADIGIHPKEVIKQKKQKYFIDKLKKDLEIFCRSFDPRPVVYRATDFKTNEYRSLSGGEAWEPEEANPMLGFRGAFRYIANPDVFNLELQAIKTVRKKYKNLWLMIPFVRSPDELAKVKRIVATEGLFEQNTFKFWMMVELPVNVILIDEFIKVGIDGISVGSNDLTMLISGTDRDNTDVAEAFDERAPAVIWSLKRVIARTKKYQVTSSICGQAPSSYDDLVEELVKVGITSISVNPDAINRVRNVIYETEKTVARGGYKK